MRIKVSGIKTIEKLILRLQNLEDFAEFQTEKIVESKKKTLLSFAQQITESGDRANGKRIAVKGYSEAYRDYKRRFGKFKNTSYVDLKLSGDFIKSYKMNYSGNLTWNFTATDVKTAELKQRYGGESLIGITPSVWRKYFTGTILPVLNKKIETFLA